MEPTAALAGGRSIVPSLSLYLFSGRGPRSVLPATLETEVATSPLAVGENPTIFCVQFRIFRTGRTRADVVKCSQAKRKNGVLEVGMADKVEGRLVVKHRDWAL